MGYSKQLTELGTSLRGLNGYLNFILDKIDRFLEFGKTISVFHEIVDGLPAEIARTSRAIATVEKQLAYLRRNLFKFEVLDKQRKHAKQLSDVKDWMASVNEFQEELEKYLAALQGYSDEELLSLGFKP